MIDLIREINMDIFIAAVFITALLMFVIYVFVLVRPRACAPDNEKLLRAFAHRGLYGGGIPENSLAAFERAVNENTGIELDIQLSSDGEIFVFHDSDLMRMTGTDGKFCDLSSSEIRGLFLSGTEHRIPTLREVLDLIDGKVPILIELKGENLDMTLSKSASLILKEYTGDYLVESFNPFLIRRIRKYLPGVCTGQLYTNVCRDRHNYSPVHMLLTWMAFNCIARPDFIAYNKECRNSFPVILATRFYHAPRFVWTLDEDEIPGALAQGEYPVFERHTQERHGSAYFAGGCFWCIEPVFEETDGVLDVTSGYSGGDEADPAYEDVKHQKTGHRETIRIDYSENKADYGMLLDIFLNSVDPFDGGGQFIDRGHSYTLAVYYTNDLQKAAAEKKISELEQSSGRKVFISVEPFKSFYPAEEEHQDYYRKHPEDLERELVESGRKKMPDDPDV